jgi:hypothetical protein
VYCSPTESRKTPLTRRRPRLSTIGLSPPARARFPLRFQTQNSSQRRTLRIPISHLAFPLLGSPPSNWQTLHASICEPPQTSVLLRRSRRGATAESDIDHPWRIIRKTRRILLCMLLVFRCARLPLSLLLTQWILPPGWGQNPTKTWTGKNTTIPSLSTRSSSPLPFPSSLTHSRRQEQTHLVPHINVSPQATARDAKIMHCVKEGTVRYHHPRSMSLLIGHFIVRRL